MELRRLAAICLVSASVIAMTSGRADATSFTYTFDSDAQGWIGNSGGGPGPLTWSGTGGNPGGNVSYALSDGISGTGTINALLGLSRNLTLDANTYGATLSFDTALLAGSNLTSATGAFVQLSGVMGGNVFLLSHLSTNSLGGGAWTPMSVQLDTSTSWNLLVLGGVINHTATQADWDAYLPFVSNLLIEDQFAYLRSTGGGATAGFDNIKLTEAAAPAVPEPTSMLLLATGLAGLGLRRKSLLGRLPAR